MKKLFTLFAIAALVCVGCSDDYDDSGLQYRVGNLESRVAKLEQLCKQMNTNISALQTIVGALQNNDYVTGVAPVTSNGETIGYTITFTKSAPITIYHGQNGKDGANGADGKDGHTPVIGVRQDTDGVYYWTLDGNWLLDNSGNKIKAEGRDGQNGADGKDGADGQPGKDGQDGAPGKDGQDGAPGADGKDGENGKDGITPQLKIEGGYWFVSTDNGTTWTNLGKATGEDGKDGEDGIDGDSFFKGVDTTDPEYVVFTLADGTTIKLPTWHAFEQLRTLCNQMNTNINALQAIISALQNNDYVKSVTPVMQDGKEIGYTIIFSKSNPITIYHGQNGKDGANGSDGKDGVNGKDGHTPVIGVRQDTDDIYYWTLDGEWLTDNAGNKIKAEGRDGQNGADGKDGADGQPGKDGQDGAPGKDGQDGAPGADGKDGENGKDGITPQLKIEGGYWFVSTDNGTTWTNLGKATGEDGKDGNSIFQSVTQDEDNIYFALANGDTITLSKYTKLSITFDCGNSLEMHSGVGEYISYTIKGGTANNLVKVELYTAIEESCYQELRVTPHTADTGRISVLLGSISGSTYKGSNKILVTVSNGETTIMTAINITVK